MVYVPRKPRTTKYVRKANKGVRTKVSPALTQAITKVLNRKTETKYKITSVVESGFNTISSPTGTNFGLNAVALGDARNQRNGNAINPTFLDIRGQVQATHQEAIWYKLILLEKDLSDNPIDDLFETDTGDVAGPSQDLRAIYQRMNNHKYKILATRVLKTGTISSTANDAGAVAMFNMKVPMKGRMVFDDGEVFPQKRTLSLIVLGRRANNDDTLGLNYELTFNSKFYYKDM